MLLHYLECSGPSSPSSTHPTPALFRSSSLSVVAGFYPTWQSRGGDGNQGALSSGPVSSPSRSCQRGVLHLPPPPTDRPGNRARKSFAVPAPAPHALCRASSMRTRTVSARNEGHPPLASFCKLSLLIVPGPGQAGAGGGGYQAGAPARSPWAMPEGSHLHSAGNASFGLRPVPVLAPSV